MAEKTRKNSRFPPKRPKAGKDTHRNAGRFPAGGSLK